MSEKIVRQQFFEYEDETPFHIYNIILGQGDQEKLMNHWHPELEMAYNVMGSSLHYIDGECIVSRPGRLVVTNSESIHSIIENVDEFEKCKGEEYREFYEGYDDDTVTVVVIISKKFLDDCFPQYNNLWFTNDKEITSEKVREVMKKLHDVADGTEKEPFDYLYKRALIMELLYAMCQEGVVSRDEVSNINTQKNIERMKGVITFISNHYSEHLTQSMVAEKFYFSSVYFSRYFKKCTGMTFTDYLTDFRLEKARRDIIDTDYSISEIAMRNGFSDDRRLIITFKKRYGSTPLQYRKKMTSGRG